MKHIFIIVALLAVRTSGAEFFEVEHGDQPHHLTPVDYPPDEYDRRIEKHLFVTDGRFGRLVIRPSFEAESCVSVHSEVPEEVKKKHGGSHWVPDHEQKYFITVTRASENLWYSMAENNDQRKTKKVKVARADREISFELAVAIQRVWGRLLQHTRYPTKADGMLDGTTYQFSVWVRGLGDLYGETKTPQKGLTAELVSLGISVSEFASGKDAREKPLIQRLKAFEAKIPKP